MLVRRIVVAILACLALASPVGAASLRAEGTEFVLHLDDGRTLRGQELVGASLILRIDGRDLKIRIDGLNVDEGAPGGQVMLYALSAHQPGQPQSDVCQPDALGRRAGFPVPDGATGFTLTCTSGAEGKCILMGYRPWEQGAGRPNRDLHRACVHMIRADYGGDGEPFTRDGTQIDVADRFGIQTTDATSGMTFEAAWGAHGAICVARPRIAGLLSLDDLARRYPHLADALGPVACTETVAWSRSDVLIVNRSYPDLR